MISLFQYGYAQSAGNLKEDTTSNNFYRIDTALNTEVEQELSNWQIKDNYKIKCGLMDAEIFTNDSETFSTYKSNKVAFFTPS